MSERALAFLGSNMTTRNSITGDSLTSRPATQKFRDNYDAIFGSKNKEIAKDDSKNKDHKESNTCNKP